MKKFVAMALCGALAATMMVGSGAIGIAAEEADEDIVIGVTLMDYNFTFYQDMLAAMKHEADILGVELVDVDGAGDITTQLNGIEDMINGQDVDAMVICGVDSAAIAPGVLECNDAGIPVVTVDVRSDEGDIVAHVASDNKEIGRDAAEYALAALKEKNGSEKGTCVVVGYPQISTIAGRAEGFLEFMADYPDVTVEEVDPVDLTVEASQSLMENVLQTYPEGTVDVIYGANQTNAQGVIAAAGAAGRTDFEIICVDDDPQILACVEDGTAAATVVQSPIGMGRTSLDIAVEKVKGNDPAETDVATKLTVVDTDSFDAFMEEYNKEHDEIKDYMP